MSPSSSPIPAVPRTKTPAKPAKPLTGRILAVLLGGLFVAVILVIAVKGFGAAGHPLLGLFVGLACLLTSAAIYLRTSRSPK